MNFAPIVLFTYRRVPRGVVESLLKNNIASNCDLFIFSDGYKSCADRSDVLSVRSYIRNITGFASITIEESPGNKGLANSVIHGVTKVVNKYRKVIVLEDDLIVSNDFLEYMNEALYFYEANDKIWSISGYGPRLNMTKIDYGDVYLSLRGTSWGWATWDDRWNSIDWFVKDFSEIKYGKKNRIEFERGGNDLYKMLNLQMMGKIDSWSIRSCYYQFLQKKYTIYPFKSKVINNGFADPKSTHNNGQKWAKFKVDLNENKIIFIKDVKLIDEIMINFKKAYDITLYNKIGYFLKLHGGYDQAKKIINFLNKCLIR